MPYWVENIMRKGEIACNKQFLLFSQCFPQLYIFSASKCGIVWQWINNLQAEIARQYSTNYVFTTNQLINQSINQSIKFMVQIIHIHDIRKRRHETSYLVHIKVSFEYSYN